MIELALAAVAEKLLASRKPLLTVHIHPDGDAIGAMLGLYWLLKSRGIEPTMVVDDSVPAVFQNLLGADLIRPFSPEKTDADLLVVLDASDEGRIGRVREMLDPAVKVLNIDHHVSNMGFSDWRWLDVGAAATAEMVTRLAEHWQYGYETVGVAEALYTGIATDCGFFRYANTTPQTMRLAARLVEAGVEPNVVSDRIETQPVAMLNVLATVLSSLELHKGGRLAMISIPLEQYDPEIDSDSFIRYPRYIEGVEVAVMLKGVAEHTTRVSMRSRELDVSKVALHFGGGGHKRAAGCTIPLPLNDARSAIVAVLSEALDNGG